MAFGRATGLPGTNTPTPVRDTGGVERLSSHRGDDNGPADGPRAFERDLTGRWRSETGTPIRVRPKGNRNKRRSY